jgi:hypothetical protein
MWGKTSNKQQVREPFCIASPWNLSEVKPSWLPPLWNPCGGLESAGVTDRILLGLEDVL